MLDGLTQFWSRLGTGQRTGLVAFTVVMLAGFALMAWWVSRPSFTVLYSGLSPEDAAAVVEQLRESNVPYRLTSGGTTVQVPYEKLYDLRLQLAGRGLPNSSTVGFELFDRSSF
ncbi:MAG: flagellar M-ring protein FliF, partial [Armatimonadetes bacterium]|nr:flagellar M-ring protein FliF [Armatimonadota bacterium]